MTETSWNWLGDHLALDFVNTVHRNDGVITELLTDPAALTVWFAHEEARLPVLPPSDAATLAAFLNLRNVSLELIDAAFGDRSLPSGPVAVLNRLIVEHPMPRVLGKGDTRTFPLLPNSKDRLANLKATLANAVVDLLAHATMHDLAFCHAPACGQYFHRKRTNQTWCCPACGDRARVARHAKRAKAAP